MSPIEGGELNSLKGKKEEAETKELPVEALVARTNRTFQSSNHRTMFLSDDLKTALKDNVVKYFLTSADRYDKDKEKGLDQGEFSRYRSGMNSKLGDIIDKYAPTDEMIAERKRRIEELSRSGESAKGEAEKKLEDITFDPTKLDTPEGVHGELQKVIAKTAKLQESGVALSDKISNFKVAFSRFEESKNDWGVAFRGVNLWIDDDDTQQLTNTQQKLQRAAAFKMHELGVKMNDIKIKGQIINDAPEKIKQKQLDKREELHQKIEEAKAEEEELGGGEVKNKEERSRLKQKRRALSEKQWELRVYRTSLEGQAGLIDSRESEGEKSRELKDTQLVTFSDHLDAAVKQIDDSLKSPALQDWQRQHLENKKQELLGHKRTAKDGLASLSEIGDKERSLFSKGRDRLNRAISGAATEELNIRNFGHNSIEPAIKALESAQQTLKIAELQQGTKVEQLMAQELVLDSNIDAVDNMDESVADTVLDINISNVQFLGSLQSQIDEVHKIEINRPNLWNSTGGLLVGKVGEGLSVISEDILDPIGDWMIRGTDGIPFVGTTVEIATNIVVGIPSGVIDGAGELITGLNTMISHPIQTWNGLGELFGDNAGTAWAEMGKALLAWEEFEKGKVGKGVGKIALNVLTTATGVGAAVKGGQALALTFKAARAAGVGVAKATGLSVMAGAKVFAVEVGTTLKAAPQGVSNFTKGILSAPKKLADFLMDSSKGIQGKLAKTERAIVSVSEDLSSASSKLDDMTIGGRKVSEIPELAGKTFDEINDLPASDLAKLGITDAKSVHAFLKYKSGLKKVEGLKKGLEIAEHTKAMAEFEVRISTATDEIAAASSGLDEMMIGNRKISEIPELAGKSLAELRGLSPKAIRDMGFGKGGRKVFLRYKRKLAELEDMKKGLEIAKREKGIVGIAPGMDAFHGTGGITKLADQDLTSKIADFNGKNPNGFKEKAFLGVGKTKNGKIIAFNAEGKLQIFKNKSFLSSHRAKAQLTAYVENKLGKLKEGATAKEAAAYAEKVARYKRSVDFMSDVGTQKKITGMFDNLTGVPDEYVGQLQKYIEKYALEQHFDNPEKYVSHGFDHSLNVKMHLENALKADPQIAEAMMTKYGITKVESAMMLKLVAVFHDFGYPDVEALGGLGKALHGVTGADIASKAELVSIMRKMIQSKGAKFDELMLGFRDSILYHSADKVEIFREGKIRIAHGEFIVDSDNIIDLVSRYSVDGGSGPIEIICRPKHAVKFRAKIAKYIEDHPEARGLLSEDRVVFKEAAKSEVISKGEHAGKFRGRKLDLAKKDDSILGIQFKVADLADDPMNYMIRLTDNLDLTPERFSALQRSKAFGEIYHRLGRGIDGEVLMTMEVIKSKVKKVGRLREQLSKTTDPVKIADLSDDIENLIASTRSKLEDFVDSPAYGRATRLAKWDEGRALSSVDEIGDLIDDFTGGVVDEIISANPEELAVFGDKLREVGRTVNSESIRHFGGSESILEVSRKPGSGDIVIKVDRAKFEDLNSTEVFETSLDEFGRDSKSLVGLGEYQIWRTYEAIRSLRSGGKTAKVMVVDKSGNAIIPDFDSYFRAGRKVAAK